MFDAYGDESCGREYITYGLVLVPDDKSDSVLRVLAEVKAEFGGTADDALHCREIFAPYARQKSAWHRLGIAEVCDLYKRLFLRLEPLQLRRLVGIAKRSDFPEVFPGGPMTHIDPAHSGPLPATKDQVVGEKELASYCAMATAIPLSKWPGIENVRFWPDPDSSSISWFTGRRKFTGTLGGFIDIGHGKEPPRINVMNINGPKPKALEIADAIASISQRVMGRNEGPNGHRFKSLYEVIAPERVSVGIGPDGGLGINVPNSSLEFRPRPRMAD